MNTYHIKLLLQACLDDNSWISKNWNMENNESKKYENSCNFYHQLHTENVNFTKNPLV